jgi:ATP synthase protein I
MDERDTHEPLRDLGRRLDRARHGGGTAADAPARGEDGESRTALALGLRIGLELLVAVFVGVALGWAFDRWLGTAPWGLIVFLLLGFAAGVTNVFRIALRIERAVGFGPPPGVKPKTEWDEDEE